jgi:hypothetical protein
MVDVALQVTSAGHVRLVTPTERNRKPQGIGAPYRRFRPRPRSQLNRDDARKRGRTGGIVREEAPRRRTRRGCPRSLTRAGNREHFRGCGQESDSAAEHHRNPRGYRSPSRNQRWVAESAEAARPALSRTRASRSGPSSSFPRSAWPCGKRSGRALPEQER